MNPECKIASIIFNKYKRHGQVERYHYMTQVDFKFYETFEKESKEINDKKTIAINNLQVHVLQDMMKAGTECNRLNANVYNLQTILKEQNEVPIKQSKMNHIIEEMDKICDDIYGLINQEQMEICYLVN